MRKDKQKAISLRKKGKSYNKISSKLKIPKSTLSYWLKNIEINEKYAKALKEASRRAGTRALIRRNKLQTELAKINAEKIKEIALKEIGEIDIEKLKLIGCALYLGEGGKTQKRVDFTNSNREIIKIIMKFFRIICKVKESKFRIQLSIHNKGKELEAKQYWSKITKIPTTQFIKVNQLISKYSKKRRKNKLPFGTIQVRIADVNLFHRIIGWIKGSIKQIDNVPG